MHNRLILLAAEHNETILAGLLLALVGWGAWRLVR